MTQLERAKKELNSQQLVDLGKQIEDIQETLTAPKKTTPPQEPMPPQGSN